MARSVYNWNNTVLTPEQTAQVLYQAGLRDMNVMAQLVAIAKRESGYRAGVHGSDRAQSAVSGDRGLFQINYIHDAKLKQAGIISRSEDLFDPVINAKAALYLSGNGNPKAISQLWGAGEGGWQQGGDPFYGTNRNAAYAAVQNAQTSGLFTRPYSSTPGGAPGSGGTVPVPYTPTPGQSAAAVAGANINSQFDAELGFVNAWAQNQGNYINQNIGFNNQLWNQADQGINLQGEELANTSEYQNALYNLYTNVNDAQKIFASNDYKALTENIGKLTELAKRGFGNDTTYYNQQQKLQKEIFTATEKWLGKQKDMTVVDYQLAVQAIRDMLTTEGAKWSEIQRLTGAEKQLAVRERDNALATATQQFGQTLSENALSRRSDQRKVASDAITRGAMTSRGFGQDVAELQQNQNLGNRAGLGQFQATERDAGLGLAQHLEAIQQAYNSGQISFQDAQRQGATARSQAVTAQQRMFEQLAYQRTQAQQQYTGNIQQNAYQYNGQSLAHEQALQNLRYQQQGGDSKYAQTAKELWARATELAAQKKYQGAQNAISGRSLENQRATIGTQANQAHAGLENQMTQNQVQQVRDIGSLNRERQNAALGNLMSLNPYASAY
jgi:hypothetical protein